MTSERDSLAQPAPGRQPRAQTGSGRAGAACYDPRVKLVSRLRPTLLDRYVVREILPPTGLGLLVFTFILLLNAITQLTAVLVARGADLSTAFRIFFNLLPSILATTIPMAYLLGVLLAFGRLASDSEIVALRASGVSPLRLLRPVIALSLATGLATFYMIAVAVPRANQQHRELLYALVVSRARSGVQPRVFNQDLLPGMVLYISDIPAETGEWKDIFLSDRRVPERPRLILARSGHLSIQRQKKRVDLVLREGVIHSFDAQHPEAYEEQRFSYAELPLPFDQFFPQLPLAKGDREMTLTELSQKARSLVAAGKPAEAPRYLVEWHKKFAIPAACLVFGLLGLGLSLGSRKEARSAAFGLSVAVIFVYYVFLRLGEQAGDTGMLSPFLSMWAANVVLGAVAILLLWLNHREAAFDPLDLRHYGAWLPRIRKAQGPRPEGRRRSARPIVLVVRVPRLTVGIPGLLDRYIAREYLGYLVLVLTSFFAIFTLTEFMDLFDDIQQNHVKGKVVLHYYLFHSPYIVHLMMPVAILVATLVTFGVMSRRNEITAMKAGGISVYRATIPVLAMGLLGSVALFSLGEFILPETNRVAEQDFNVIKGRPPQSSSYLERRWILGSDGEFYNYDYMADSYGEAPFSLYGLSVYDVDTRSWRLRERLQVARADWNGVNYTIQRGWRRSFGENPRFRPIDTSKTREIEPPSYFRREDRPPDTLGFAALARHIDNLERLGLDVVKLKVQLQKKLAFPFLGVVMTLIGIPFSFVVGRKGALHGIAISILVAMVYWALLGIFEALGNNALLPPILAAWAPNLIFAAAGIYLMLTLET